MSTHPSSMDEQRSFKRGRSLSLRLARAARVLRFSDKDMRHLTNLSASRFDPIDMRSGTTTSLRMYPRSSLFWSMSLSENRCAPSGQARGQAFRDHAAMLPKEGAGTHPLRFAAPPSTVTTVPLT